MLMERLKNFLHSDETAVSPVIGVILMVAITVILAAVIASFVLGLGDQSEPAPNPTIETDYTSDSLTLDVTGGEDFDATVTDVQIEAEVTDTDAGNTDTDTITVQLNSDDSSNFDGLSNINWDVTGTGSDEATAGDTFTVEFENTAVSGEYQIESYDIQVIWNPADSDSEVIYEDSGSR